MTTKSYQELVEEGKKRKHNPVPKAKPEKVWGFTVLSFFGMLLVYVIKYLVDFLLIPKIFPDLFPISWAAVGIWAASSVIFTVISFQFITRFGWFYLAAAVLYALLVLIWPMGLYGTAETAPIVIAVLSGVILDLIQRLILWVYIGIGFITM